MRMNYHKQNYLKRKRKKVNVGIVLSVIYIDYNHGKKCQPQREIVLDLSDSQGTIIGVLPNEYLGDSSEY